VKIKNDDKLMVSLYVDDLIFMSNSGEMIEGFKRIMKSELEMTDL
jgi:Reverse transcriptase (RNA-dependent DNA polymerase)